MTSSTSTTLSTARIAVVDAVLDVLIPGGAGMPSARAVATTTRWLPTALDLRSDLRDQFVAFVDLMGTYPPDHDAMVAALREVATSQPSLFAAATGLLAGAYYLDPVVRGALGYPGQEERALLDETGSYIDLLERVVERGPAYRDAPLDGEPSSGEGDF
ncbi:MAG: hypothetical protein QM655_08660 [Nocardioidaceae bacterium]